MPVITLTTDFGEGGRYVAQMKGVLFSRAPGVTVVDLSHAVPPQDVAAAAKLLLEATPYWPEGAIHLAVVDPGVGTDRPIVVVEALGQRFVGPDNGLFGWLADRATGVVRLDPSRLELAGHSATFHGRDVMAPAAALLATGARLADLGPEHSGLVQLPGLSPPLIEEERVTGHVTEVDHYGNLITNVRAEHLDDAPHGDRLRVRLGEHETFGLWHTYDDQPAGTLLALIGSGGFVELAITRGNAAEMLDATAGDVVGLEWNRQDAKSAKDRQDDSI